MTEKYETVVIDGLTVKVYNFITGEFTTEYSDDTLTDSLDTANEVMYTAPDGYAEYAVHKVVTDDDGTVRRVAIL